MEPSAAGSFEYLSGGDSAIVAVQYSYLPSWLSFLVDQERAREAGRLLFDAVYERWSRLPPATRPRLYVFGESLGSFGGETAFSGEFDLANRTDGALFVGPPSFNPLYRGFVDDRDPGSREIEPTYRDGRTVRFSNRPRSPVPPRGRPWDGARVLYLQHPSDPVTWWSPTGPAPARLAGGAPRPRRPGGDPLGAVRDLLAGLGRPGPRLLLRARSRPQLLRRARRRLGGGAPARRLDRGPGRRAARPHRLGGLQQAHDRG